MKTTKIIPVTAFEKERIKHNQFKTISFEEEDYECRVIKDKNGENLLIGSYELSDALHPGDWEDENEGFASEKAEEIYNKIFYFMDSWELTFRSDKELIEELKESNPDRFV